jgi:hypothetical protein
MAEITRKPTARQVEALRTALTNADGIIEVSADKRTHEGLVGRDLADWKHPEALGRGSWGSALCVITEAGRKYLAKLDGTDAEQLTREDVGEAVRVALGWLSFSAREAARGKSAVEVLEGEFKRARLVMRRAMKSAGAGAAHSALKQYERVAAALKAARRFEAQQDEERVAVCAAESKREGVTVVVEQEPREFQGLTRDDVARAAAEALEALSAEDRAAVEGKAPSVVLGLAFRRAQAVYCATRRVHTNEEIAAYHRTANLASAAMIFERADDPEAAAVARADDFLITNVERAAESKRREEARAASLVAEWRGAERHGKYLVRTEDRGHGIVAVYVKGPAAEVNSIDRASVAYAQANGLRPGASAGGGEVFRGEYIAQRAYHRA